MPSDGRGADDPDGELMTTSPDGAARRPRRRSFALAALVGGLVVAITIPLAWYLSRPEATAGLTLAEVRAEAGEPTTASAAPASPGPSTPARTTPSIGVRDASLENNRVERVPEPTRVRVPSLDIDASIAAVGVEADGSMVIPAEVSSVGWYEYGPAPGAELGNAVLAGHVDTAAQGPGALFRMREVEVGAIIEVTDASGAVLRYEVQGKEAIVKSSLPVDEVFARNGPHVLVLVTCGGPFIPEQRSYSENLVVTAVPVT